jgi:PAS domain S-box-containing protein/diguanylate cyclase (GGDEF)-like protein
VPYLVCKACGFRAYSAAVHPNVEDCPVCGTSLPKRSLQPRAGPGFAARRPTAAETARREEPLATVVADIESRLGTVPTFFEPALANPEVLRELWRQTRVTWLDSPVPEGLRRALLQALAKLSPWPWRAVADDASPAAEPLPADLDKLVEAPLDQIPHTSGPLPLEDWPAPGTVAYDELLILALRVALDGPREEIRRRLQQLLGAGRYAELIGVFTYLQACSMFAQAHPGIAAAAGSYRRRQHPVRVVMIETDAGGTMSSFSPAAEDLFACPAGSAIGRPLTDLFAEDSREAVLRAVADFAAGGPAQLREQSLAVTAQARTGDEFEVSLTLANRRREGEPGAMTAFVDVVPPRALAEQSPTYRMLVSLLAGGAGSLPPATVFDVAAQAVGWGSVVVWRFDAKENLLRCIATRKLEGEPVPEAAVQVGASVLTATGPVGSAFSRGAPVWIDDLATVESGGRGSGLWLPVGREDQIKGVVELRSSERRPYDEGLVEMLNTLAGDAGRLLEPSETELRPGPGAPEAARLAFEGAPIGMALLDLGNGEAAKIVEVNRAMANLFACDPEDLLGRSLDEITEPGDAGLDADLMERLRAEQIPSYVVTKPFRRADGTSFWGDLSVSLIRRYATDEPLYLVVQLSDVDERKRAEDALEDSRERLASVFDEAPIGMAIATLDGRWVQVNAAICETFGYTETELLTKPLRELIAPEDVETVQRLRDQLFGGEVMGYHMEVRASRADDAQIWIQLSVSLVHDYAGEPAYVLAEVQEVTERKRVEQELEDGALRDVVTGLPSRTLLLDRLEQALSRLERTGTPFVVMLALVEGFDTVSETLGRDRADAALREVGARLQAAVRATDTVGHYGPDEFVLVCGDLEHEAEVDVIARRIVERGQISVTDDGAEVALDVTVGVTVAADRGDTPAALVERADAAMQLARKRRVGYQEYRSAG